jgi:hypothetical protein
MLQLFIGFSELGFLFLFTTRTAAAAAKKQLEEEEGGKVFLRTLEDK